MSVLGRWRQEDPWDSKASQPSVQGELQGNERPPTTKTFITKQNLAMVVFPLSLLPLLFSLLSFLSPPPAFFLLCWAIFNITGKSIHEMPFPLSPSLHIGFICLGYHHTEQTEVFKDSNLFSHSSRAWKSKIRVDSRLISQWFTDRGQGLLHVLWPSLS